MDLNECIKKGFVKKDGNKVDLPHGKEIIDKIFIMKNELVKKYLGDLR
jgi:hypothetical protein